MNFLSIVQRSANFAWKSSTCQYFRLCGPSDLYCNSSALFFYPESSHRQHATETVCWCSTQTLQKSAVGQTGPAGCSLLIPGFSGRETVLVSLCQSCPGPVTDIFHESSQVTSLDLVFYQEVRGGDYSERVYLLQILGDYTPPGFRRSKKWAGSWGAG